MTPRDAGRSFFPMEKGQTAVLGLVLLIGMVAIVSVGMLVVAGDTITSTEQETENERVEQAFIELSQQMATTAVNNDTAQSLDLDTGESGAVIMTNTGNIHIRGDKYDENISIGAIEYEGEDGTKIAYQAGGVFRETMNETRVQSAPPVHFEDETLSFPVVEIDDEDNLGTGDISIRKTGTEPVNSPNVIQGETVKMNITSQYYLGWKQYFEHAVGDAGDPIQESGELNETHGYVEVELGHIEVEAVFDNAVVAGESFDDAESANGGVHWGTVLSEDVDIEPIDDEIDSMINNAESGYTSLSDEIEKEGKVTSGEYYIDGTFTTDDYTFKEDSEFDVSDGNITLVVNGDITINEEMRVDGWQKEGNEVQIYTNGAFNLNSDIYIKEDPGGAQGGHSPDKSKINSQHLQLYGNSDFEMAVSGNTYYEGVVYAPGGKLQESGTPAIYGSIVTGTVNLDGNSGVWYDEGLQGFEPRVNTEGSIPPDITHLNVVEHSVEITSD